MQDRIIVLSERQQNLLRLVIAEEAPHLLSCLATQGRIVIPEDQLSQCTGILADLLQQEFLPPDFDPTAKAKALENLLDTIYEQWS